MSEREWTEGTRTELMLRLFPKETSERKLRLFAVACCRAMLTYVSVPTVKLREIVVAELFADGMATADELDSARTYSNSVAEHACMNTSENLGSLVMADAASCNAAWATTGQRLQPPEGTLERVAFDARMAESDSHHSALLRDIIGNPFRPMAFDPAWRSEVVVGLARGIYEERAFERMPILADALQDAGCEHPDILAHCREPGEHVRGCWVVDLVLGKV